MFRDNRGMIIDFDSYPSTWGGFEPFDEEGEPIRIVKGEEDNILTLPATPPEEINNHYGLLYGVYKEAWSMNGKETFLQYCANPEYGGGGRGNISIAGDYSNMPIEDLCLKFEVYIPKECTFKCRPRVEIFFGPYESANKHGRELSPIYAWAPCESNTDGFYTKDGWETISVPLTEFNHSYESDEIKAGPINLKTATNFTFVIIGDPGDSPSENYLCVDNFRIVPIK